MFKYYYLFNMIIERNINILIKCHDVGVRMRLPCIKKMFG